MTLSYNAHVFLLQSSSNKKPTMFSKTQYKWKKMETHLQTKMPRKIWWHIKRQDSKEVSLILIKICQKLQKRRSFHTMCIFSYYKAQTTKKNPTMSIGNSSNYNLNKQVLQMM